MTRTLTPRFLAPMTASAISLHVMVNTHTSRVLFAPLMCRRSLTKEVSECA